MKTYRDEVHWIAVSDKCLYEKIKGADGYVIDGRGICRIFMETRCVSRERHYREELPCCRWLVHFRGELCTSAK